MRFDPATLDALKLHPGVTVGPTAAEGIARLTGDTPHIAAGIGEKEFQQAVTDYAETRGWHWWHVTNAKKSKAGWPDLVLLRDRIVVAELKVPPNQPTADQLIWLDRFRDAKVETHVWFPANWPQIEEVLA